MSNGDSFCSINLNKFIKDTDEELEAIKALCEKIGVVAVESEVWAKGGDGGIELAKAVMASIDSGKNNFHYLYRLSTVLRCAFRRTIVF